MSILDRISALKQQFLDRFQEEPTALYLGMSAEDEFIEGIKIEFPKVDLNKQTIKKYIGMSIYRRFDRHADHVSVGIE